MSSIFLDHKAMRPEISYKENVENNSVRPLPEWLEVDKEKMSGKVVRLANREDIDLPVEEHLIVELYSK